MGGYGSGGWNRTGRAATGDTLSLDVNYMNKSGCLKPGAICRQHWTCRGEPSGDIGTEASDGGITLIYRTRSRGGECQDVRDFVAVIWEPCPFGGQRPYFLCPGCGRRIVKLYGMARFRCRQCNRLVYHCQRETKLDRVLRKDWKLRAMIGGEPGMASPIPGKPKHMHWRTYNRIIDNIYCTEALVSAYTMQRWGAMF